MEPITTYLASILAAVLSLFGALLIWRIQDRTRAREKEAMLERIHELELKVARLERNGGGP